MYMYFKQNVCKFTINTVAQCHLPEFWILPALFGSEVTNGLRIASSIFLEAYGEI
jgi:hypothetical protein